MQKRWYYVVISYYIDKCSETIADWVETTDSFAALDKVLTERGVDVSDVFFQDVISKEHFEGKLE